MRLATFSLAAVVLSVASVGCQKPDPTAPVVASKPVERAAASGDEVSAGGVTMTFPKGWRVVDMSKGQLDAGLTALGKDPRAAEMAKAAQAAAQSGMVKLIAFAPENSKPGFMNNVNLVVQPGAGTMAMDAILDMTKKQMATMDPAVATSKVSFPAGEFGRLESHLKTPTGVSYTAIGYMKVVGNDLDVVTFSCTSDLSQAFDAKAQEVMRTFKAG